MRITPTGDNILIDKEEIGEQTTPSGIVIQTTEEPKPYIGRVVAVGAGMVTTDGTRVESEVKEGDRVVFNPYAAGEIELEGKNYTLIRESDLRCILS